MLLALLLAALWPLATSHCSLEKLPGFAFLACAEDRCCEPEAEAGHQSDACAVIESGFCKLESDCSLVPAPPTEHSLIEMPLEVSESFAAAQVVPESSPPELSRLWQFSTRTALPPRAPSFDS
jgi:hypothetical protein